MVRNYEPDLSRLVHFSDAQKAEVAEAIEHIFHHHNTRELVKDMGKESYEDALDTLHYLKLTKDLSTLFRYTHVLQELIKAARRSNTSQQCRDAQVRFGLLVTEHHKQINMDQSWVGPYHRKGGFYGSERKQIAMRIVDPFLNEALDRYPQFSDRIAEMYIEGRSTERILELLDVSANEGVNPNIIEGWL